MAANTGAIMDNISGYFSGNTIIRRYFKTIIVGYKQQLIGNGMIMITTGGITYTNAYLRASRYNLTIDVNIIQRSTTIEKSMEVLSKVIPQMAALITANQKTGGYTHKVIDFSVSPSVSAEDDAELFTNTFAIIYEIIDGV